MSEKKNLNELTDLHANEVSLVDRGANKKKRFPIFKEETMDEQLQEILKAVLETEVDEESQLADWIEKQKVSEKGQAAIKSALRILSAYKDELPKGALDQLAAAAGYPSPKGGYPEPKSKGKEKEEKETKVKKEIPSLTPETEAIFKAQEAEINALKERNDEIQKALKAEQDKRELETWIAKVKEELAYYPGKSVQELGEQLKKMNDVDPELAKSQFELMRQASSALKESAILKERGTPGGAPASGSAWEEINKKAAALIEKSSDVNFTREKAVARIIELHPELYQRYQEEHTASVR